MIQLSTAKSIALGALVAALSVTAVPVVAQDAGPRGGQWSQGRSSDGLRARGPRQADARQADMERGAAWRERRSESAVATDDRAAPRPRSYGAYTRQERREDARETERDFRQGYRAGQRADGRDDADAYRQGYRRGQREDWRDDRRDQRQAYNRGYRAGDRADDWQSRGDFRRWDNRGWRNDRRYDWYRYRAANRPVFSLGRYYAPHRGYRYNRLSIGVRLGSPFYANRYWINDPWRFRLPQAYGPYRWVRYYDDALLVDVYSGRVVDVIHEFFW